MPKPKPRKTAKRTSPKNLESRSEKLEVQTPDSSLPTPNSSLLTPDFPWITEQLRPFAVPMADIIVDPRNARGHDERNIKSIQGSLRRFGQVQPLVVNRTTRVIAAGNGRYVAAQRLGWTHIAVVYVDQDAQSHAGYALADNRTAELAEWIETLVLEEIAAIQTHERDLADELLLEELRADCLPKAKKKTTKEQTAALPDAQWQILITCRDEAHQVELLQKLGAEGLALRAILI